MVRQISTVHISMVHIALTTLTVAVLAFAPGAVAFAQEDDPNVDPAAADPTRPPTEPPTAGQTPAQDLSPEDRARRARIVARVGDVTITLGDVEDSIAQQSPFIRARYRDRAQLEAHVQSMVRFELLARAAERAGVGENAEIRRTVNQTAVQQLIRREFDERMRPDNVPAEQVQEYYDGHPAEFTQAEMRRASHIQVATREEADRLLAQVADADARRFRELAREQSTDPETRLRGGDLRYFDEGGRARNARDPQVDEAIAAAAFAIEEVGGVAGPIEVGERWSVIKLTGRRPAEHRTAEQAEPTIRLRLWRENRQQAMEDFVARLRRESTVEVHHDLLRNIHLDPPEGEGEEEAEAGERTPRARSASDVRVPAGRVAAPRGNNPAVRIEAPSTPGAAENRARRPATAE